MKKIERKINPLTVSRVGRADSWRADKENSNARGYGHEWRIQRAQFLADHPYCAINGEGCTIIASVVDHIIEHGGNAALFWDQTNWQSSCSHCHNAHKQRDEHRKKYWR